MIPTQAQKEIIHRLLLLKGITTYVIVPEAPGGNRLPGRTRDEEIGSLSGFLVTPEKIYWFWFDWYDGHYTLGEEEGYWEEADEADIESLGNLGSQLLEIQQQLRQK